MIWITLQLGLRRAWSTKRLLLVFYLASLLAGVLVALPLREVLLQFAGRSLAANELIQGVTLDFLFELVTANRAAAPALTVLFLFGAIAFWVLSLFLSGGALAILAASERGYQAAQFWGGAAKFFGRFLRLALWSLLLLAALSLLPLTARGAERFLFGPDPYQYVSYWGAWIGAGFTLIALFFFRICFDYARIHAVVTDEAKMRRSLWRAVRFTIGNAVPVVGLALVLAVAGGVAALCYLPVSDLFDGSTVSLVTAAVVAQQLFILWRVTLRLTRYGSQIALYQKLSGEFKEPHRLVAREETGSPCPAREPPSRNRSCGCIE